MTLYILWGIGVFFSAAAYDFVFARYLAANTAEKPAAAASWSVLTYWVGLIGLSSVLRVSMWFFIPESMGLWLGTFLAIRLAKRKAARSMPKC